jgi:hypothetical protein
MKVERVYAGGVSQSATYLIRYYNSVHPVAAVYDGFLIGLGGAQPRADLRTKLLKITTESDVWRNQAALRVADTDSTHTWEVAGAAHVGTDMMARDPRNFRGVLGGIQDREKLPPPPTSRCERPFPANVETWAVFSAGYAALDRWVTGNVRPPTAMPIEVSAAPAAPQLATIVRDSQGIAAGGIRLPRVAVPTALNTGENFSADPKEPGYCDLFGTHLPFDAAKVKMLYPSRAEYGLAVRRSIDELVHQGFVLKEDAPELFRNAEDDLK